MNQKFKVGDKVIVKSGKAPWRGSIDIYGGGGIYGVVDDTGTVREAVPERDLLLVPSTFTQPTKFVFPGGTQETQYLVSRLNDTPAPSCNHSWSLYRGISQQFEYCTKCDEKRAHKGLYDK